MPVPVTSKRRVAKPTTPRPAQPAVETKHQQFARMVAELRRDAEALVISADKNLARLR